MDRMLKAGWQIDPGTRSPDVVAAWRALDDFRTDRERADLATARRVSRSAERARRHG